MAVTFTSFWLFVSVVKKNTGRCHHCTGIMNITYLPVYVLSLFYSYRAFQGMYIMVGEQTKYTRQYYSWFHFKEWDTATSHYLGMQTTKSTILQWFLLTFEHVNKYRCIDPYFFKLVSILPLIGISSFQGHERKRNMIFMLDNFVFKYYT